jgi:hypothetical protein
VRLPAEIKPGTRVDCNVRGRCFTAGVVERTATGVRVDPPAGITYHHVLAAQVKKLHRWDPARTQVKVAQ